jgi:hypothetical protein
MLIKVLENFYEKTGGKQLGAREILQEDLYMLM